MSRPRGREGARSDAAAKESSGPGATVTETPPAVGPANGEDELAPAADETHEAVAVVESEPVAPYVAGGLGLLALILAAGFFWYRRRLP